MNAQSRPIEDALRRANIPYHIVGNIRFYERREIKDTLAYLKAVLNPNDDVSLRRIINVPPRKIGRQDDRKADDSRKPAGAPKLAVRGRPDRPRPEGLALGPIWSRPPIQADWAASRPGVCATSGKRWN